MVWTVALAAVSLWAGVGCAGWAQGPGKRAMTFADLQRIKRVSDPQVSPSGKWVLFSVVDADLEKNSKVSHLWVTPLGGPAQAMGHPNSTERQVTFWKEGESGGRFSPDGRQVLFVANDATGGATDGKSQIFLAPWNEASGTLGTPVRLTHVSTEADGAIWSPNSKRILFTSRVYPECSDEETWLEEDTCDKRKDDAAAANPVKAQVWDHLLYRHWDHYVGPKRSHVLVVSAADGNAVRDLTPRRDIGDAEAPTFSLGGPLGYAWAPGSEEMAYVANLDLVPAASTNNDVFTLLLDDPGARPRRVSTSPGSDDGPAYSPDGKYLAFRSQARAGYESDRFRLMVFDRLAGTTRELMPNLDGWIDEMAWWRSSKGLIFLSGHDGREDVYLVDVQGKHLQQATSDGEFGEISTPAEHGSMVASLTKVNRPTEIVSVDFVPGNQGGEKTAAEVPTTVTQISHLNDVLVNSLDLPKMETYWFTGAEGAKVQGFVIRPPGFDASRRYPVKFLIHGGPQGAWGDAWSYRWNPELMAASGYVVVMVNPRGSTGYGQAFIDGVNGDWGGKAYVDLMKGLDAAEAKYPFLDKTRECALGASYGGYMADWMLTHTDRFACIVTHDGMFNPQSAYGDTDELWFNEWEFRRPAGVVKKGRARAGATGVTDTDGPGQPWKYAGGPIAEDPFRKWSPMLSIQNAKTPTLVIHSQRDYRLDVSEGMQLFTALQRLNVPSRMLYFPDEGHWILKPQNSRLWYQEVGAWCDRWTKSTGYDEAAAPAAPTVARVKPEQSVQERPKVESRARVPAPAPTSARQPAVTPPTVAPVVAVAPEASDEGVNRPAPVTGGAASSIAISGPPGEVRVGADVPVTITLKNVSDRQILFAHKPGQDSAEFSYEVEVKNETGRVVPPTAYGREAREAKRRQEEVSTVDYLQPGGTTVQTMHLQKVVSFSRPGRYTVQVSRRDSAKGARVLSNVISITVGR